jgi:hypothetical protein
MFAIRFSLEKAESQPLLRVSWENYEKKSSSPYLGVLIQQFHEEAQKFYFQPNPS